MMKWIFALSILIALPLSEGIANGVSGTKNLDYVKSLGATSIRTYDEEQLKDVQGCEHGLEVYAGILVQPHEGTDQSIARARDMVNKYRGMPCLKSWIVGNELDNVLDFGTAFAKVEAVARVVKEMDPGRRRTSCLAGILDRRASRMKEAVPSIDYVCINCYSCANNMCSTLQAEGYHGDYIVGEYGLRGWWEVPTSSFGAAIEPTSTEKAMQAVEGYNGAAKCSGGPNPIAAFTFFNGNMYEVTKSWFSLWDDNNKPVLDRFTTLKYLWHNEINNPDEVRGKLANARIPQIERVWTSSDKVGPWAHFEAFLLSMKGMDAGHFRLTIQIRNENEDILSSITTGFNPGDDATGAGVQAPGAPGRYRVHYILENPDFPGIATANVPILVT